MLITFCWLLVTGVIWTHGVFQSYFSAQPDSLFEVEELKKQVASLQTEKNRIAYQFEDFRQNAAVHWPEARKQDYRWPASQSFDLSSSQYEKGRVLFKQGSLDSALQNFELLIAEFPYSKWIAESYYYRCEILFQMRDFKKFTSCVTEMTELFPENTLTGFQLLRFAQTHEIHGQMAEALEIYRLIQNQFGSDGVLKGQAGESLERLRGAR